MEPLAIVLLLIVRVQDQCILLEILIKSLFRLIKLRISLIKTRVYTDKTEVSLIKPEFTQIELYIHRFNSHFSD